MGWFAIKTLGLHRWVWVLILLAAIVGLAYCAERREQQDDKFNQEVGATVEREANTGIVLQRTEQGNEARAEAAGCAAGDAAVCHDLCMRYDSGAPESCERFLPERP